ncbi:MAG: thioredoxin family protein, partial [Armatimonadota bacterium]
MKNVMVVNDSTFDSVITSSTVPVLIDFWAEWCGPCRMLGPIIEEVSDEIGEKAKICKLNVDESPAIAQRYGIMSIPADSGEFRHRFRSYHAIDSGVIPPPVKTLYFYAG